MDAKGYSKLRKVMTKDNFRGVSLKYLVEQEPEKFWSTPTTMDSLPPKTEKGLLNEAKARPGRKKPSNLRDQVTQQDNWEEAQRKTIWPTPVVSDYKGGVTGEAMEGYSEKKKAKRLSALKNAVLFPTPCITGLSSGTGNCEKSNQLYEDGVINDDERRSFRAGNGGQLNPDWEEFYLMGWPFGWSNLQPINKEMFYEWERFYRAKIISSCWKEAGTENVQRHEERMRDMSFNREATDTSQRSRSNEQLSGEYSDSMCEMPRKSTYERENRGTEHTISRDLWQDTDMSRMQEGVHQKAESGEVLQSELCSKGFLEETWGTSAQEMCDMREGICAKDSESCDLLAFMQGEADKSVYVGRCIQEEAGKWKKMGYQTVVSTYWMPDPAEIGLVPRVSRDVPYRKERMIAIGNGQVPSSALLAEEIIYRIGKEISY